MNNKVIRSIKIGGFIGKLRLRLSFTCRPNETIRSACLPAAKCAVKRVNNKANRKMRSSLETQNLETVIYLTGKRPKSSFKVFNA